MHPRLAFLVLVVGLPVVAAACSSPVKTPTSGSRSGTASSLPPATSTTAVSTTAPSSTVPASSTTSTPPASGIVVGPGAQATYTVQPQPAAASCHYGYSGPYPLPDPRCTPGAVNPNVTQATIASTICVSGYTSSIRPPESITEPEKVASAAAYGYTGSLHTAEYDHLISLELGGDPDDPANLWVEPNDRPAATTTANSKDVLENRLHDLVCDGRLTLAAAQQAIATNWVGAYKQYG